MPQLQPCVCGRRIVRETQGPRQGRQKPVGTVVQTKLSRRAGCQLFRLASAREGLFGEPERFSRRFKLPGQRALINGSCPVGRLYAAFINRTSGNALTIDRFVDFCIHAGVPSC